MFIFFTSNNQIITLDNKNKFYRQGQWWVTTEPKSINLFYWFLRHIINTVRSELFKTICDIEKLISKPTSKEHLFFSFNDSVWVSVLSDIQISTTCLTIIEPFKKANKSRNSMINHKNNKSVDKLWIDQRTWQIHHSMGKTRNSRIHQRLQKHMFL